MRLLLLAASVFLFIDCSSVVQASERRVSGSELVAQSGTIEEVLFDVLATEVTQVEIDLLIDNADTIILWIKAHLDEWIQVNDAPIPLERIRSFDVWDEVSITSDEFITVMAKLTFLQEYSRNPFEMERLKSDLATVERLLESEGVSEELAANSKAMASQIKDLLHIVEDYIPDNLKVFEKNKERVAALIAAFNEAQPQS